MKYLILAALAAGLLWPRAAAAYEEEGLSEAAVSTDTANGSDEDEDQTMIQENDEDLADFVTDYIRKDVQLKGAFFIEDRASKKVLKLELVSVENAAADAEGGTKKVTAVFKDAAGKKVPVAFYLQNGPWGGLDIFKMESRFQAEKPAAKPKAKAKDKK
jgi:hypothetical protein